MLYKDNTTKLLNLQDFEIEKIEETEKEMQIYGQLCRHEQYCPCCGAVTETVHDYRIQRIKDLTILGKRCVIMLKKRRYRCNECGKRFYEHNEFVGKYQRMTKRLIGEIIIKLVDVRTYKSVAEEADISATTVQRIFDNVNYPHISEMPEVLAIDEFKGNASGEKYQCILTDPTHRRKRPDKLHQADVSATRLPPAESCRLYAKPGLVKSKFRRSALAYLRCHAVTYLSRTSA